MSDNLVPNIPMVAGKPAKQCKRCGGYHGWVATLDKNGKWKKRKQQCKIGKRKYEKKEDKIFYEIIEAANKAELFGNVFTVDMQDKKKRYMRIYRDKGWKRDIIEPDGTKSEILKKIKKSMKDRETT